MGLLRSLLLSVSLGATVIARPCMWDRDTLAEEAKGHMDFVGAMVGRFDRNPPLYYEMRLRRVSEELKSDPRKLDLYDDAGVAAARLGKFQEAMGWMERKRKAMEAGKADKDAWYRYYSNLGTFTSYDLFADDRSPAHLKRLQRAINLLESGLKINPNAHFGREVYQLKLIKWVQAVKTGICSRSLSYYVKTTEEQASKILAGYVGLVRLGSAWGSADVFSIIRDACSHKGDSALAQLAEFRAQEIVAAGAKPLVGDDRREESRYPMWMPDYEQRDFNLNQFRRLRKEADQIQETRSKFMVAKMILGKHPDLDGSFWSGYIEPAPIEIESVGYLDTTNGQITVALISLVGIVCFGLPIAVFLIVKFVKKRRRLALEI